MEDIHLCWSFIVIMPDFEEFLVFIVIALAVVYLTIGPETRAFLFSQIIISQQSENVNKKTSPRPKIFYFIDNLNFMC